MALADIVGKVTGKDSDEVAEDFPETDDVNGGDGPDPKAKRPPEKDKAKASPAVRVPPHVRREIEEKLDSMIEFFAMTWSLRDDYCPDVLDEQRETIVKRAMVIICKRPAAVRWFTEGADFQDWLMLATVLKPVSVAFWSHHVAKDRGRDDDDEQDTSHYAAPPLG